MPPEVDKRDGDLREGLQERECGPLKVGRGDKVEDQVEDLGWDVGYVGWGRGHHLGNGWMESKSKRVREGRLYGEGKATLESARQSGVYKYEQEKTHNRRKAGIEGANEHTRQRNEGGGCQGKTQVEVAVVEVE